MRRNPNRHLLLSKSGLSNPRSLVSLLAVLIASAFTISTPSLAQVHGDAVSILPRSGERTPWWKPAPLGLVSSKAAGTYVTITASEARAILDSGSDVLFLDVREQWEYDGGHVPGALNMPWSSGVLTARHGELPPKPIVVYCKAGSRSAQASSFLVDNGHADIYNMSGGYTAWTVLPTRTPTVGLTPTPSSTPTPTCRFDPNGDGKFDSQDLLRSVADIQTGTTTAAMLLEMASVWMIQDPCRP